MDDEEKDEVSCKIVRILILKNRVKKQQIVNKMNTCRITLGALLVEAGVTGC
jgi:hypothetical protein